MTIRTRAGQVLTVVTLGTALGSGSASAQETLTVAYYGGSFGDGIRACAQDTFAKSTGVRVIPEIGVSTVTLAKLQQQKGNPAIDVAWIDGGISELAIEAQVVAGIDPAKIPNIANTLPEGIHKTKSGEIYALGTGFYSVGITYNTKYVKNPPTSWLELWRPDLADLVTIPSPVNAAGIPFIAMMARIQKVPLTDPKPVFAKIKQLKAASYYDAGGAAQNSFQTGEVGVGALFNVTAWNLVDQGMPIGFIVPREGAIANDIRVHIVRGTKKQALAERFVNHTISPEVAACLAEKLYVGPVAKYVKISDKAAERLPWGKKGSVKNLALFDWNELNARRSALQDMWNREIARK